MPSSYSENGVFTRWHKSTAFSRFTELQESKSVRSFVIESLEAGDLSLTHSGHSRKHVVPALCACTLDTNKAFEARIRARCLVINHCDQAVNKHTGQSRKVTNRSLSQQPTSSPGPLPYKVKGSWIDGNGELLRGATQLPVSMSGTYLGDSEPMRLLPNIAFCLFYTPLSEQPFSLESLQHVDQMFHMYHFELWRMKTCGGNISHVFHNLVQSCASYGDIAFGLEKSEMGHCGWFCPCGNVHAWRLGDIWDDARHVLSRQPVTQEHRACLPSFALW